MPLSSVAPWLLASICSTGCCLEAWILAQLLSHHESLQCCLPLALCAELALCTCSVPTELTLCSPPTLCSASPASDP